MVTTAPSRLDKTVAYAREHGARIGLEVLVNFVGPFVIYSLAKPALGDVNALIASSAPPIGWSIFEFIKNRRVDALSMLVHRSKAYDLGKTLTEKLRAKIPRQQCRVFAYQYGTDTPCALTDKQRP